MELPYFLNPNNYLKVLYKPHKIIPTLKFKFRQWYDRKYDVKFRKGNEKELLSIHIQALNALERINSHYNYRQLKVLTVEEYITLNYSTNEDSEELGNLFINYGSDKASTHDYYKVYFHLLKDKREHTLRIFEIGLGTNNIDIPSNMGRNGKPGASLRAFRDFLPNSYIYGADIDKRILFKEARIETLFIDQTDTRVLNEVAQKFENEKFDLIIDDGWHVSQANLNTIDWGLNLLNDGGVLVVEDVRLKDYILYQCIGLLIQQDFNLNFLKGMAACMVIISKKTK